MGVIESKKDGIVRSYQLKINLKEAVKPELMDLTNWSFADIKQLYDTHCRKGQCPYIDFFTFHKVMPFTTEVSRHIFASIAAGDPYLNIYELVCSLIFMAHNSYRKKLQFIFVLFDFLHQNHLTNRQMILIFQSTVNGFCRITGQPRPRYEYLNKYTIERFIRANSLEAFERIATYRRLIEEVQGNADCFELFKRFDQEIYGMFTQESYLFRVSGFKKYDKEDVEKIYRMLRKVNLDKNYQEVELVEENKKIRLQNRKSQCIRQLMEQKQEKFKKSNSNLKTRSSSIVLSTSKLPSISNRQSLAKLSPTIKEKVGTLASYSSKHLSKGNKVLILNGKTTSKEDVFETIKYFKSLSGNKPQIKRKEFVQSFDKKTFIKKQIGSLYRYFDIKMKGQVSFDGFLRAYYHNITQPEIDIIKDWLCQFKSIHQADHYDGSQTKQKQKKTRVELPRSTLQRMDEIFGSIDKGRKGYLSWQDIVAAYKTGFTLTEMEQMMRDFGKNNKIYKQQFIRMTLPEDWTIEGTNYVGA